MRAGVGLTVYRDYAMPSRKSRQSCLPIDLGLLHPQYMGLSRHPKMSYRWRRNTVYQGNLLIRGNYTSEAAQCFLGNPGRPAPQVT